MFTSLTKQALPVIRYRTRDLTRLLPGVETPMRRMARITGRSDDMLIVRGVNIFPTRIEEQVLKCPSLAPHFVVEITRPCRMDEVRIDVETRDACDEATALAQSRLLASHVRDAIGITVRVTVVGAGTLPRLTGKASRIRDLRAGG